MREPLFIAANQAAWTHEVAADPNGIRDVYEAAGLHRATTLATESAFTHGIDFPVGAVAIDGSEIVGRGYAGDRRLGFKPLHAEVMALIDTSMDIMGAKPRTVVVTAEPCGSCQDTLAANPGVERVVFCLSRQDMSDRGLVRPHDETIFERAKRLGLPYEVAQINDAQLRQANLIILDSMTRDVASGLVTVDRIALSFALGALNRANR